MNCLACLFGTLLFLVQDPVPTVDLAAPQVRPGAQVEGRLACDDGATVGYLLYLPEDYSPDRPQPLMLFLHGRGESRGGLSAVAKWGPPRMAARGDRLPWIIVSPQCPADDRWDSPVQQERLLKLLDNIRQTLAVDASKILVTGLSMGGAGTWSLASAHPELFAAAVPVCGWGNMELADRLAGLPVWAWHGTDDPVVPFAGSRDMIEAIAAAGGQNARLTGLEGIGHNSWSAAYESPDLWDWMAKRTRQQQ